MIKKYFVKFKKAKCFENALTISQIFLKHKFISDEYDLY